MLIPESTADYPILKKPECAHASDGAAALRMA
jgi:hypothetical protein